MNTTENNKLIAEFMGLPKVPCNIGTEDGHFNEGYKHPKVGVPIIPSGMQYKYSWDWLMPVVEKIESLGYHVDIVKGWTTIINQTEDRVDSKDIQECDTNKKEATYKAVVEFIKQYNENERLNNEYISYNDAPYGQD